MKKTEKTQDYFELSFEYKLIKADQKEFSIYDSVYGDMIYNRFAEKTWKNRLIVSLDNPFSKENACYFIYENNIRIGGVLLEANVIARFFVILPFENTETVMSLLVQWLLKWSDRSKKIYSYQVPPTQFKLFEHSGFQNEESRRWMSRPTEFIKYSFEDSFTIKTPRNETQQNIEILFKNCFDDKGFRYVVTNEELIENASTLIYDSNEELIGACIISEFEDWPLVHTIGVIKKYQNEGLASEMLKRAIHLLHNKYDILRLFVTIGNPAEKVYMHLGFIQGVEFRRYYYEKFYSLK